MEKPYIVEDMLKKLKDEVKAEFAEKEAKGLSDIGISDVLEEVVTRTLEAIDEEEELASNAAEFVSTCNHLNPISDNNLNASNSPLMTKSPTPTQPQSPKPSLEHTPSPKYDHNLYMGPVISFPQPNT